MKKTFNCRWPAIWLLVILFASKGYGQIKQLETVEITVLDMDKSVAFYTSALGFAKISDQTFANIRNVRMTLGAETIAFTQHLKLKGRPVPADMKSNDLYFQHIAIVVSDMDKAYAMLKKHMASSISTRPQTIPASNIAAAGIRAYYFRDIDNHNLELIYFPKGKGKPKWQITNGKLFLGVDHTAISISDNEASIHFYQDLLGLARKGDSWNKGMEQMNLSNVKGASLHITQLGAKAGLGIELLQYLVPGPGRPYPADTRVEDAWYLKTILVTDQLDALYQKLNTAHFRLRSKILNGKGAGKRPYRYFTVQDRDGHAVLIKQ